MRKLRISLVFVLAAAFLLTSALSFPQAKTKQKIDMDDCLYSILSEKDLTVRYEGYNKKFNYTMTSIIIPDMIGANGKFYKVVQIGEKALEGFQTLKKLTIGQNVQKIGKKAFYNCKNLKTVLIKTSELSKTSLGSSAFTNINPNAVISVPEDKLNVYKTLLKSKGLNETKQKVKAWKTDSSATMTSLPEQSCGFSIGDKSYQEFNEANIYDSTDTITFSAGMRLHHDMYGTWKTKTILKPDCYYDQCGTCGMVFESESLIAIHIPLTDCICFNDIFGTKSEPFDVNYFIPDDSPCKVVYHFEIPEGLSYKDGSLRVEARNQYTIDSSNYHTQISKNSITVTIDDIKNVPYYYPFDIEAYEKNIYGYELGEHETNRPPIVVIFDTELNDIASVENKVSASISYEYKGMKDTVNLVDSVIYAGSLKIENTDDSGNSLQGAQFSIYNEEAVFENGSNYGILKWKKMPGSYKAGDVIKVCKGSYKIVQENAPLGYEKAYDKIVDVSISHNGSEVTVAAKDGRGNSLPVHNGTISANIVNSPGGSASANGRK